MIPLSAIEKALPHGAVLTDLGWRPMREGVIDTYKLKVPHDYLTPANLDRVLNRCAGCEGRAFVDSGDRDIPIKPCPTCKDLRAFVQSVIGEV